MLERYSRMQSMLRTLQAARRAKRTASDEGGGSTKRQVKELLDCAEAIVRGSSHGADDQKENTYLQAELSLLRHATEAKERQLQRVDDGDESAEQTALLQHSLSRC